MACLEVLDVPFWGLKASPAILDVLYGGLGINVIFEQKNIIFFQWYIFFNFWSSKPWIRIHIKSVRIRNPVRRDTNDQTTTAWVSFFRLL